MKRKRFLLPILIAALSFLLFSSGCLYYVGMGSDPEPGESGETETTSKYNRGIHIFNGDHPVHFTIKTDVDRDNGYHHMVSENGDKMELPPGTYVLYWGSICPICEQERREYGTSADSGQ